MTRRIRDILRCGHALCRYSPAALFAVVFDNRDCLTAAGVLQVLVWSGARQSLMNYRNKSYNGELMSNELAHWIEWHQCDEKETLTEYGWDRMVVYPAVA